MLDVLLKQKSGARGHPSLGMKQLHPVLKGGDETQVLLDVLLANEAHWDICPSADGQGLTEDLHGIEDAL